LDLRERLISGAEVDMCEGGPRSRVDKLLKKLEKMDLLIVDKYGVPLPSFLRYPEGPSDVEPEDHSAEAFQRLFHT
jgi:hypothetical protein